MQVLRLSRPRDKSLSDALTGSPPAEKLGQSRSGKAVHRDHSEEGEHGQALAQVDVRDLLRKADVPASRRPLEFLRLTVGEEQRELERLREANELELRRGRESLRDVRAVEGSAEAHVSRALGVHERMFARPSSAHARKPAPTASR